MEQLTAHARSALAAALVWSATAGLLAQAPQKPPAGAGNAQRFVVIGCIARETPEAAAGRDAAGVPRFTLTDTRSDPPTTYRLQGDASQLDFHTGHTVEIAGPLSAATEATGRGAAPALTLKVASLIWISTNCVRW